MAWVHFGTYAAGEWVQAIVYHSEHDSMCMNELGSLSQVWLIHCKLVAWVHFGIQAAGE